MKISSRRYIGCKTKLLDFIFKTVTEYGYGSNNTFFDVFAGTGVVANYFANKGFSTILNDNLYSNFVIYQAYLGKGIIDYVKIKTQIKEFNNVDSTKLSENYFSEIYGNKYYHINDAKKIGYIRDLIEERKDSYSQREYYYMIAALIYVADRIANTVGHFESFLKKEPKEYGVDLKELDINPDVKSATIYNEDANSIIKKVSADIVYLDPPYNARQYINFYHVLENLARWNKPTEFEGNSMKFKRDELKSNYCRSKAPELMQDLVKNTSASLIIVSYSNTYKAGSISSINMITEDQMIKILESKGKVTKLEKEYKAFSAGKTDMNGHKEYLYVCEVGK